MLNLMMIAGTLFDSQARRMGGSLFRRAFATVASLAPQAQLATAALLSSDAAQRAQMVVTGCERIVLVLCAALVARAIYGAFVEQRVAALAAAGRNPATPALAA